MSVIPAKFKCPKDESECAVAGALDRFCPYAHFPILEEKRFSQDCEYAPVGIWKSMKNRAQRIEYWFDHER